VDKNKLGDVFIMEWIKGQARDNLILANLESKFYISYVKKAIHTGESETALCIEENGDIECFILKGDWRSDYEQAFPNGLEACRKVYLQNYNEFGSLFSNPY
jgi:hypothetical protein